MSETHQARAPTIPRTGRPNREPLDADEVIAYALVLAGDLGVSIKSYSITTDPSVGSANASSLTTGTLYKTGTVTITAKVTDSRGRTATKSATFSVSAYAAPVISGVTIYRCKSDGTRDDVAGTCAYVKADPKMLGCG